MASDFSAGDAIAPRRRIQPSIYASSLPRGFSYLDQYRVARRVGFEGVEAESPATLDEAKEMREAAQNAGISIHSLAIKTLRDYPLSAGDECARASGVKAIIRALENAKCVGADTVLVVPGVVNKATSYKTAYARSQAIIRDEILPAAREFGVVLGIENTWDGILLGPLEYARFIDEFESPYARACFDAGNCILGYPQYWIEILGSRIVKLHVKDFRLEDRTGSFSTSQNGRFARARIGKGTVDWAAVSAALVSIDFSGWATCAEMWHWYAARALNRVVGESRNILERIPLLHSPLFGLQKSLVEHSLRDAAERVRRYLP